MDNTVNKDILKLAECPICTELKLDHRILVTCGHSFCLEDIEELVKNATRKCPLCRTPFTIPAKGVQGLIKDFYKIALVELALKVQNSNSTAPQNNITNRTGEHTCSECSKEGIFWCQEDECLFCETHAEEAHRYGKSKSHSLVHPSQKKVKVYCEIHKKEIEVYCLECSTCICMECFLLQHMSHKIGTLDSVAEERKKSFVEKWRLLEHQMNQKLRLERKQLDEAAFSIAGNITAEKQKVEAHFQTVVALLQKRKQEILNVLTDKELVQIQHIVSRMKNIHELSEQISLQGALVASSQELSPPEWLQLEQAQDLDKWTQYQSFPVEFEITEAVLPDLHLASGPAVKSTRTQAKKANDRFQQFDYQHDFDTNGVLYWLGSTQAFQLVHNAYTSGRVDISTSHALDEKQNIISGVGGIETFWGGSSPQFFVLDLKKHKLLCNCFTIRHGYSGNYGYLQNWELSASNDGSNWEVLFAWNDKSTPFDGAFDVKTWSVADGKDYYRFFRILQKENYSMGNGSELEGLPYMCINGFELYGDLQLY